jgi:RNA-binding protein
MNPLSSRRRSELRAEAHKLSPVVIIGDKGLTDEVVAEVERSLVAHELIKVRALTGEREAREAWLEALCERLRAHAVQQIGKVFVLYRENPKEREKPTLGPGPSRAKTRARGDEGTGAKRTRARGDEGTGAKRTRARGDEGTGARENKRTGPKGEVKRTSRPRSRTPSPPPESAPRRRRRSTSL